MVTCCSLSIVVARGLLGLWLMIVMTVLLVRVVNDCD